MKDTLAVPGLMERNCDAITLRAPKNKKIS